MVKERKVWQIMAKEKYDDKWYTEKFMTGGRLYYSFAKAQDDKRALKSMSSSTNYKVVRIQ